MIACRSWLVRLASVAALSAGWLATPAYAAGTWVSAWGTAQQLTLPLRNIPAAQKYPEQVVAQTLRMVARPTVAGSVVRVALSNSFGYSPVRIDSAQVARSGGRDEILAGTERVLTFGGRSFVMLPPGALIYSDPVAFDVRAQVDVVVSLYLETPGGPTTAHPLGLRSAWIAPGNQAGARSLEGAASFRSYLWLAGIDVLAKPGAAAIVALGDSITDGYSTTPDADTAWPSILARRLASSRKHEDRAVLNMGISGNRVLREGAGSSALARFDRDVLARSGVRWVVLLEGINDIGFSAIPGLPDSEKTTAAEIIAGYRLLIGRAQQQGLKVIGGTLTPFEGVATYSDAGEQMRQQVNAWIRGSREFDAVVDFDAAVRDPAAPTRLAARFDSGDHIHPNDAGNEAMAAAVDIGLFR
jgi:lysophospholipase L1-like esterase